MTPNLQLLDTVTFSNKLSTNFSCNLSEDGRISLITESGVLIYTLTNYMDNVFTDIAFKKNVLSVPEFSALNELAIDFESLYDDLMKDDLFEKILRLDMTSKLKHSTPVDVKPIAAKWSPKGIQGKSHSVLGVLSNCYVLSIFIKYLDDGGVEDYQCVTNVTDFIVHHYSKEWKNVSNLKGDELMVELKMRIEHTFTTAFTWSSLVITAGSVYTILFVAHVDGSISSWKFFRRNEYDGFNSHLTYAGVYHTSLKNINVLYWNQTRKDGGALCFGNTEGKLAVVYVPDLTQEHLEFKDQIFFLNALDKKNIDHITSIEYDEHTYLIAVQGEYLRIWAITHDGTVLDEVAFEVGNHSITGISHYKDNILLVLTFGKLSKVTVNFVDSCVYVEKETVALKFDSAKLRTYGLVLSKNRIFLGILAYPCRLKNITRDPTPANFIVYHDSSVSPFQMILKNTHESLETYWDYFEVLRFISYKEKRFPWYGIEENLDYDNLTPVQLKSLRWIAKLSENVYHVVPFITEYNIKPYILLHHMVTIQHVIARIRKLLGIMAQGKNLSLFQMRSVDIESMFLKEMVLMKILEKSKVGEKFIDDIIDVLEKTNELEYPDMPDCFWCEEKIIGPTCIPPHADSRCSISMMQIELVPGFKCPFCKCLAHIEIAEEMDVVTCPYCDIPMDQLHSIEKIKQILKDTKEVNDIKNCSESSVDKVEEVDSTLLDNMENTTSYLTLSDSEDEDTVEEKSNFLQNKFFEMMKSDSLPVASQDPVIDTIAENIATSKEFEKNTGDNENSDYSFGEDSDVDEPTSKK